MEIGDSDLLKITQPFKIIEHEIKPVSFSKMKPILCVGMVCEDTIVKVDKFPTEDSDQRTLDQWKTRGGNASNMSTVISDLGLPVE